ncbi:hypothetical protein ACHAXH_007849 [Discostella pseudostelligera]
MTVPKWPTKSDEGRMVVPAQQGNITKEDDDADDAAGKTTKIRVSHVDAEEVDAGNITGDDASTAWLANK